MSGRRARIAGIAAVTIAIFAIGYVLVLDNFDASFKSRSQHFAAGPKLPCNSTPPPGGCGGVPGYNPDDAINLSGHIVSISPDASEMVVHWEFQPTGSFRDPSGTVSQAVMFLPAGSEQEHLFPAHQDMGAIDVKSVHIDGEVGKYPFDEYAVNVYGAFLTADTRALVPTRLDLVAAVHGFDIDVRRNPLFAESPQTVFQLRIGRASSTVFFSVFLMVFMWALALAGIAMAIMLTFLQRDIGPGPLGFLAALLFAFPAMRGAQPGAPPIGTKSDYLAFFWTEAIVGITLTALAIIWIVREVQSERRPSRAADS